MAEDAILKPQGKLNRLQRVHTLLQQLEKIFFPVKSQLISTLGFAGCAISVTNVHFCCTIVKASIQNT